jgi:hypothetical protein
MKAACVFAGYFRTWDYVKDTFVNRIMNPLTADIFFSSPKTVFSPPENEVREFHHIHSQNQQLVEPVISFFGDKLKSYELRDSDQSHWRSIIAANHMSEKNIHNQYHWRTLAQIHGISASMQLFKRYVEEFGITYDLVILARPDVKYYSEFNVDHIDLSKVNYQTHSMNNGRLSILAPTSAPSPSLKQAFNDQILAGSQSKMLSFASAYDSIIRYHKEGICFNTETLLGIHCVRNGIPFTGSNYILYELWRDCSFDTNVGYRADVAKLAISAH